MTTIYAITAETVVLAIVGIKIFVEIVTKMFRKDEEE